MSVTARHLVGSGAILVALMVSYAGWKLSRRYARAIEHRGIGRPYPFSHSFLAFLGDGLVLLGLIGVVIALMLGFF